MRLPPLLLVGQGRMGGALLAGWAKRGLEPSVVVDPALPASAAGVTVVAESGAVPAGFAPAAVVLAVKPQMAAALPGFARFAASAVVLSVMAGLPVARLSAMLNTGAVVRAMPNTPASIGQGFTACFAGPGVSAAQRALCDDLLGVVGEVDWVEDEALIDPVTAISGGGPAYVFLLAELLERAALAHGLPPAIARRLARKTVSGSGALLASTDEEAASLRRAVTSPGGTTERALAVLMADDAWPASVAAAIDAATARSRALAG